MRLSLNKQMEVQRRQNIRCVGRDVHLAIKMSKNDIKKPVMHIKSLLRVLQKRHELEYNGKIESTYISLDREFKTEGNGTKWGENRKSKTVCDRYIF